MNEKEKLTKVGINWYPGHMVKTKRQILEDLKLIDVVIELLDARIPISSQNPDISEMIKNKKRIVILNKSDLASDVETKKWIEYFRSKDILALAVDSNSGKGIEKVSKSIEDVMMKELDRQRERGRIKKTIRVMILGIPNVGKSSFINRISKKTSMTVGNRPGVTRQKQWIRIGNQIELLDTPGVLWPKFDEKTGLNLAYTGSIKDDVIEIIEVAYSLLVYFLKNYIDEVVNRYLLDKDEIHNILSNEEIMKNERVYEIMKLIGKKRGAIISGGKVDDAKTARIILEDFRSGRLGRITLEKVK